MENWALWGSLGGLGGVLGWSWGVWRGKGAADCAERLNKFPHFGTWTPDSRPFQPVPGRKFHIESEFDVKNNQIQRPEAKKI